MAEGIKISEMDEMTALTENCYVPIIDEGVNKKVNFEKLKDFMISIVYPVGAKIVSTIDPSTWLSGTTWSHGSQANSGKLQNYGGGARITVNGNDVYEWTRTA